MRLPELARFFGLGLICLGAFFFVNSVHNQTQNRISALKKDLASILENKDAAVVDLDVCHRFLFGTSMILHRSQIYFFVFFQRAEGFSIKKRRNQQANSAAAGAALFSGAKARAVAEARRIEFGASGRLPPSRFYRQRISGRRKCFNLITKSFHEPGMDVSVGCSRARTHADPQTRAHARAKAWRAKQTSLAAAEQRAARVASLEAEKASLEVCYIYLYLSVYLTVYLSIYINTTLYLL